jgi:hypothetical protein
VAVSVPQRKHAYRTQEFDNFDVVICPLAAGTLGLRNAPGRASANSAGELTDTTKPPASFAALKTRVAGTLAGLAVIEPSEVDAFVGREMRFVAGDRQLAFTAGNFTGQLRTKRDSAGVPMRAWADPESGASSFEYRGQ